MVISEVTVVTVVTVELVDVTIVPSNGTTTEEMIECFKNEVMPAPWVKEVKNVFVEEV